MIAGNVVVWAEITGEKNSVRKGVSALQRLLRKPNNKKESMLKKEHRDSKRLPYSVLLYPVLGIKAMVSCMLDKYSTS